MTSANEPASGDADAIRSDIEQTRAQLANTVDQLSDKMNVKAQASDKVAEVKGKIADSAAKAKAAAPPGVQRAIDKASEKATPIAQQVGAKAQPYRGKLIAAGVVLVLLIVRLSRRGGDE
ncbi:MAG: DUF3618 domain-containing protein [Actinomycetota bacterium]|nr:DUF3618 domain-containing protein [Actinomycetota bacterium]